MSETQPLVSVIMPCFNAAQYIELAIESVLHQSWANLELLVIDDGSTDDSGTIAARVGDSRVRIIRTTNGGVAKARNRGLAECRGDLIAFLDADDYWHASKIQRQIAAYIANPGHIIYSAFVFWKPDLLGQFPAPSSSLAEYQAPPPNQEESGFIYHHLLRDVYVWTGTVVIPHSMAVELGTFDESLRIGEDYDYWLRAAAKFPFIKIDEPLALYRQNSNSITSKAPEKNYQAIVLERHARNSGLSSPDGRSISRGEFNRILAHVWDGFGSQCLAEKRYREAAGAYFKSIIVRPLSLDSAIKIARLPIHIVRSKLRRRWQS